MPIERHQSESGSIQLRLTGVVSDGGRELELVADDDYGRPILICLRDVTLLNSTGIGLLLKMNRQVKQRGGKMVLHSLPPYVRQVIDFMKLDQTLRIAKGELEAKQMLT